MYQHTPDNKPTLRVRPGHTETSPHTESSSEPFPGYYQDAEGKIPVTAVDQPVGFVRLSSGPQNEVKLMRVRIRRDKTEFGGVKPNAEEIDGKVYRFVSGSIITEGDHSLYVGETIWYPADYDYPDTAPSWIASGDLEDVP